MESWGRYQRAMEGQLGVQPLLEGPEGDSESPMQKEDHVVLNSTLVALVVL